MASKSAELYAAAERAEAMEKYRRGHDPGSYWRVGKRIGRTIYAVIEDDEMHPLPDDAHPLVGVMDTAELAAEAVRAHNTDIDARSAR